MTPVTSPIAPDASRTASEIVEALEEARERTLALVASLSTADLERVHSPIMGPLVWDLAHIAAYEDLWLCHRACGLELLRPDLAALYDAFETPRAQRADDESGFLRTRDAYAYMEAVQEHAREGLERAGS